MNTPQMKLAFLSFCWTTIADFCIVKERENNQHQHGHTDAKPHLGDLQRENGGGAEQRGAHVAGQIGRFGKHVED